MEKKEPEVIWNNKFDDNTLVVYSTHIMGLMILNSDAYSTLVMGLMILCSDAHFICVIEFYDTMMSIPNSQ